MTATQWLIFILIIQVIHFLGTWKLYVKAGRQAWEAAIPVYNAIVLMQIINRPKWWVFLLFIPIVNLFMFPVIWIETIRSFGKKSRLDSALVILTLGFYIYYINYATDVEYIKDRSLKPNSAFGDWVSSIAFAIIAATTVHTYIMQPYTIPSSSLEKSLLIGDFLFVSKFHYGARVPMTTVALPMVHDSLPSVTIPYTGIKTPSFVSYLKKPQLPYYRLPGFQKIKRNEIVVFNWPADSLATMWGDNSGKFTYKPVDKKTNYVKRCVAIAGDSLQIINGDIYINGKLSIMPDRAKPLFYYTVYSSKGVSTKTLFKYGAKDFSREFKVTLTNQNQLDILKEYYGISHLKDNNYKLITSSEGPSKELIKKYRISIAELIPRFRNVNFTKEEVGLLNQDKSIDSIIRVVAKNGKYNKRIFPHNEKYKWSQDNFGPIYIPKKGETVELNNKSIPFYKHLIEEYEYNQNVVFDGDKVSINGELIKDYTFKQDYYWLMGDNRHNSLDARYWGFVPFDHVVGKPVLIWMSYDGGIFRNPRWERFFTTVHGEGKATSFRYLVFGIILLWIVYSNFIKKKKKA